MGTIAVIVIYSLLNMLYLYAMPVGELAAVKGSVFDLIGERMLGARAGDILGLVAMVSVAAGINAMDVRRAARVLRDGARRRVLSRGGAGASAVQDAARIDRGAGRVGEHPDSDGQPRHADRTTSGLPSRSSPALLCAAVFVLRAREPNAPRPYKTLGYPIAPAIFVAASFAIVVNAIVQRPVQTGSACSSWLPASRYTCG